MYSTKNKYYKVMAVNAGRGKVVIMSSLMVAASRSLSSTVVVEWGSCVGIDSGGDCIEVVVVVIVNGSGWWWLCRHLRWWWWWLGCHCRSLEAFLDLFSKNILRK